jgi:hypothetical protein
MFEIIGAHIVMVCGALVLLIISLVVYVRLFGID